MPSPVDAAPSQQRPRSGELDEQAVQSAIAQAEQEEREEPVQPDDGERQEVKALWEATEPDAAFEAACSRYREDHKTLFGAEETANDVGPRIEYPKILRKKDLTEVLCVPDDFKTEWRPAPKPAARGDGGTDADGTTVADFAELLTQLDHELTTEAAFGEHAEDLVRHAACYEAAWMKATWQSHAEVDAHTAQRSGDDAEVMQRIAVLAADLRAGRIDKESAEVREMARLAKQLDARGKIRLHEGFAFDVIPMDRVRPSAEVTRPADLPKARRVIEDFYLPRDEVLQRYPDVSGEDLQRASVMQNGEMRSWQEITNGAAGSWDATPHDTIHLREVWDTVAGEVVVMIEGLEYFAARFDSPCADLSQKHPYFLVVLNPHTRRLWGISQTRIQQTLEAERNKIREQHSDARVAAIPRGMFDADVLPPTEVERVNRTRGHEWQPVRTQGSRRLADHVATLPGANAINPLLYDVSGIDQDQDEASGISGALTSLGRSNFAAEVKTANVATTLITGRLQRRVWRPMEALRKHVGEILVREMGPEYVQRLTGNPRAVELWGQDVRKRLELLKLIDVHVEITSDARMDRAERKAEAIEFASALRESGAPVDPYKLGRFLGKAFGYQEEAEDLMQPDLAVYLQLLVQDPEATVTGVPVELLRPLAALGDMAAQVLVQAQAASAVQQAEGAMTPEQGEGSAAPAGAAPPAEDAEPAGLPT